MLRGADLIFGSGAKAIPYDAEVDYIELTGTQYAVLPFKVPDNRYEIDVEMTDTTSEQCLIGCRSEPSNRVYPLYVVNGVWNLIHAYASINSSAVTTSKVHVSAYCQRGKQMLSVDGEDLVESSDVSSVNSNFAFLGACNVNGTRQLFAKAKISRLVVYAVNGELVFDAISVRFTNELRVSEGAMYDRVSGQLFRNAGTGAFVVGPDKGAWTNPFDTDGLVHMWNARWNAEGGVHDGSATVWKDLVGDADILLTSDQQVTDNSIKFTIGSTAQTAFQIDGDFTLEVDVDLTGTKNNWTNAYFAAMSRQGVRALGVGVSALNHAVAFLNDTVVNLGYFINSAQYNLVMTIAVSYSNGSYRVEVVQNDYNYNSKTFNKTGDVDGVDGIILGGGKFASRMRGVRVYNRVRTREQIEANFAIMKELG